VFVEANIDALGGLLSTRISDSIDEYAQQMQS
jgi:hypothetical protein